MSERAATSKSVREGVPPSLRPRPSVRRSLAPKEGSFRLRHHIKLALLAVDLSARQKEEDEAKST